MTVKKINMDTIKHCHMIGVAGAGMSGIAEILLARGYRVTGSDKTSNAITERLQTLGATTFVGHQAQYLQDADIVIYSSAISGDNPEMQAAKAKNITCIQRGKMLAELTNGYDGIAVAGTHGKTTVTALMSTIFIEAGVDPSYVIGSNLTKQKHRAKQGLGNYFLAEADESDASFLYFKPKVAIVNNIEPDHMKTYNNNDDKLKEAFLKFVHQLSENGVAVLCADDPVIKSMKKNITSPAIYFGFSKDADVSAANVTVVGLQTQFTVNTKTLSFEVILNMPGKHNIVNALAAISVALHAKIPVDAIQKALNTFQGVDRRFSVIGDTKLHGKSVTVIDDYGHHPSEIDATMSALRDAYRDRRIVLAYQPHRYTRTRDCFNELVVSLLSPDLLLLVDTYSAGETPIDGMHGEHLLAKIKQDNPEAVFVASSEVLLKQLASYIEDNDVLVIQGAGDIGEVADTIRQSIA